MSKVANLTVILAVLAFGGCATSGDAPIADPEDVVLSGVADLSKVMQLTGEQSPNETDEYTVHGTDLGSMFEHDGFIYFAFGDTFGPREAGATGAGGALWRSNVLAYTSDRNPRDGIAFDGFIVNSGGSAKQVIYSSHSGGEVTKIPTGGVSANGNIYLYFMSVRKWGDHGNWLTNYGGVARSEDDGQSFEILEEPRWPGDGNFIQVSVAPVGEYLYFWGIPAGRFGGVQLMRVRPEQIEALDAYEYFAGSALRGERWVEDPDDAVAIVDPPVGELSVMYNEYLERWTMTYLNEESRAIEIREAKNPWGPWSAPFELVSGERYPGLYGAYMHPEYVEDQGRVVYFNMSQWGPYNVFLMRAELERLNGRE